MKTWRYIRRTLTGLGYTRETIPDNSQLSRIDDDAYLYFTDADGDQVKAQQGDSGTTLVDKNVTIIRVTPTGSTVASGATEQLTVVDQDLVDAISECVFVTSNAAVATVTIGGLVAAVIDSGTATITATHNDGPTDTYVLTATTP